MRHTVAADERVTAPDGAGGEAVTWVQRLKFKARIEPVGGREQLRGNQLLADVDTRITLRYSRAAAAITPTWRLRHGGRIYDISAPPIEKNLGHAEIEILASSGLNDG